MSGIYIKDIAVPKSGYVDVRIFHDGRATTQTGEHPFYREMDVLEILPHGRLIDADALDMNYLHIRDDGMKIYTQRAIEHAPTIIPADVPENNVGNIPAEEGE